MPGTNPHVHGQCLASGGGKPKEGQEEVGGDVNNYGTGGGGRAVVGPLLQVSVLGRLYIWLRDLGGNHFHWDESGGGSTTGWPSD